MLTMTLQRLGEISVSAHPVDSGLLIIGSRTRRTTEELYLVLYCSIKRNLTGYLDGLARDISEGKYSLLPVLTLRSKLDTTHRLLLTQHLLAVHRESGKTIGPTIIDDTAWRWEALIAWGESAAATALADHFNISVRTIQSRLRLARDRGLLTPPGSGSRLPSSE
jgi:hypothetical protein